MFFRGLRASQARVGCRQQHRPWRLPVLATAAVCLRGFAIPAFQTAGTDAGEESMKTFTHILAGFDGEKLTTAELTSVLRKAKIVGEQDAVSAVEVVPGTELRWPQSHSAKLRLAVGGPGAPPPGGELLLYFKKVLAQGFADKSLAALRRDLLSNRNEARFYNEFAPVLKERGVPMLEAYLVEDQLTALDQVTAETEHETEEEAKRLRQGGLRILMECAEGYEQYNPLTRADAELSLTTLAKMHAAAWEDRKLLQSAAERLHLAGGGYWTLPQRGEAEMEKMRPNWQQYVSNFKHLAPDLFASPGIPELPDRIERVARYVAKEMAPGPEASFATLIHGDYKAMNVFLRQGRSGLEGECAGAGAGDPRASKRPRAEAPALLIDFQWTGLGFGMSDVALHLSNSVEVAAIQEEGERDLVNLYYDVLTSELAASKAAAYSKEVAWRHYCLGVIEYARMLISVFLQDASPERFAARADQQNVGFAYRNVEASFLFVKRADRCLRVVEEELAR